MIALLSSSRSNSIRRCKFQDADDINLMCDMKERDWESLYVEAEK